VNLAVFDNMIDGILREINLPGPLGVAQNITNVGDLRIRGAEIEAQASLGSAWTISVQAGYLDGDYESLQFDLNGDGTINDADFALQPPRLAPWTYGGAISLDLGLGSTSKLASRISFNHRDENFYTDNNRGVLNAVDSLDANITFRPSEDGHWAISVYGTNLLDEASFGGDTQLPDVAAFGGDGPTGPRPPATFSPLNKGRVVGADVRFTF
jgi:iron complex outermembrane receptor protein